MRATTMAPRVVLIGIIVLGCSVTRPAVVTATDEPFPATFAEAGQWQPFEIGSLPGAPARFGSLDLLVKQLDAYLQAGIKVQRPDSGVTITVPDGASRAQEIHLFATTIGGATDVSSGKQMRLVVRRDAHGWWLDPRGEMRLLRPGPVRHQRQLLPLTFANPSRLPRGRAPGVLASPDCREGSLPLHHVRGRSSPAAAREGIDGR